MVVMGIVDEHPYCFIATTSWISIGVKLATYDENILITNGLYM